MVTAAVLILKKIPPIQSRRKHSETLEMRRALEGSLVGRKEPRLTARDPFLARSVPGAKKISGAVLSAKMLEYLPVSMSPIMLRGYLMLI